MRKINFLLIAALLVTAWGTFQFTIPARALSGALSFTPTYLYYGNLTVGTTSAALTVTVKNISGANLKLGRLTVTGEFILNASDCQGKLLIPNQTCVFKVRFAPTTAAYKTGFVTVPNDVSPSADTVSLSGYGITGTNILHSPNFDFPFSKPIPWKDGPNPLAIPDALDCSVSVSPLCSVKLTGNSYNFVHAVAQALPRVGLIGDKYLFRLSSKARGIPAGGQYKVEVLLMNMYNVVVGSETLHFTTGTHEFETVTGTIRARAQYTWVVFRFTLQKTGGTAWFDNAQLIVIP
jgi:hypothetical protein